MPANLEQLQKVIIETQVNVLILASAAADYMTGELIVVDGGYLLA